MILNLDLLESIRGLLFKRAFRKITNDLVGEIFFEHKIVVSSRIEHKMVMLISKVASLA